MRDNQGNTGRQHSGTGSTTGFRSLARQQAGMPGRKGAPSAKANGAFHLYDASQDVRSLKPPSPARGP